MYAFIRDRLNDDEFIACSIVRSTNELDRRNVEGGYVINRVFMFTSVLRSQERQDTPDLLATDRRRLYILFFHTITANRDANVNDAYAMRTIRIRAVMALQRAVSGLTCRTVFTIMSFDRITLICGAIIVNVRVGCHHALLDPACPTNEFIGTQVLRDDNCIGQITSTNAITASSKDGRRAVRLIRLRGLDICLDRVIGSNGFFCVVLHVDRRVFGIGPDVYVTVLIVVILVRLRYVMIIPCEERYGGLISDLTINDGNFVRVNRRLLTLFGNRNFAIYVVNDYGSVDRVDLNFLCERDHVNRLDLYLLGLSIRAVGRATNVVNARMDGLRVIRDAPVVPPSQDLQGHDASTRLSVLFCVRFDYNLRIARLVRYKINEDRAIRYPFAGHFHFKVDGVVRLQAIIRCVLVVGNEMGVCGELRNFIAVRVARCNIPAFVTPVLLTFSVTAQAMRTGR